MERKNKSQEKQRPGFVRNLRSYFIEYTENTSLHGVKYIGERKRTVAERMGWCLVFGISVYLCVGFMLKAYRKWQSSPVIVSFAEKPWPIWKIPFPAVTICPQTKSRQTVYNFTKNYHKFSPYTENSTEAWKTFQDVQLVCDFEITRYPPHLVDEDSLNFLSEIAPLLNQTINTCEWRNEMIDCERWFSPVLTDEGICYSFNVLNVNDIYKNNSYIGERFLNYNHNNYGWTMEKGYKKGAEHYFPKRARTAGSEEGLTLILVSNITDQDYMCKGPFEGFKILLHQPGEIPRVRSQYIHLPLDHDVVISVKPEMMTTSDELEHYEASRRLCYFSTERSLLFFKMYSQQNCEFECITNYTLAMCNCTAYYMPRGADTRICGLDEKYCQFNARDELISASMNDSSDINCDCLPDCTSITYNTETSIASFDWMLLYNALQLNNNNNTDKVPNISLTKVTMYFRANQFVPSCRYEVFGITDFISDCGGLFGLFIGFSILSLVEIIYFGTVRLFCNIRRYGKHYWSGSPDLLAHVDDGDGNAGAGCNE